MAACCLIGLCIPRSFTQELTAVDQHQPLSFGVRGFTQVPPTVDNSRESLMAKVEEALGLAAGSLNPPHRLDAGTEGVVVLGKTGDFVRWALMPHMVEMRCFCASACGGAWCMVLGKTGDFVRWACHTRFECCASA